MNLCISCLQIPEHLGLFGVFVKPGFVYLNICNLWGENFLDYDVNF